MKMAPVPLSPDSDYFLSELCKFGERYFETDAIKIYLSCNDKDAVERMRARGRASERNASLSFSIFFLLSRKDSCLLNHFSFGRYELIANQKRLMDSWALQSCDFFIDTSVYSAEEAADQIITRFL
jgi:hypothetical protein